MPDAGPSSLPVPIEPRALLRGKSCPLKVTPPPSISRPLAPVPEEPCGSPSG